MCKSIVLTGGPGSGKTRIAATLAERCPDRIRTVPEAATQVYAMLATRWDCLDTAGRRDLQRRIYRLQVEQEALLRHTLAMNPLSGGPGCSPILLLDRGTVDGAAYWPDGPDDYWRDLGTTHAAELARYDAVIWLESAAAIGLYDGDASNSCRFEDAAGAIECGRRLESVWADHPHLFRIGARPTFEDKLAAVERAIHAIAGEAPCP